MAGRSGTEFRRACAVLFVGMFVGAGCGAATGQATRTSGNAAASSTGSTPVSQPAGSRSTPPTDTGHSGLAGQAVTVVCGGASSGAQGCTRRPVLATIDVFRMPAQRVIATVRTDKGGHFRVTVSPGAYELRARAPGALIWARVVTTHVVPHQITHMVVTFVPRHPLPVAPGSASG